jgi:RNA polymerase sigma-70 factor (ECF subfamily)
MPGDDRTPKVMKPPGMNEDATIDAFRRGDEFAFVTLYNRYRGPVYIFCSKLLLDEDLAGDALQETFLRVYENRGRLLRTTAFRSWLFAIARNQCYNAIRQGRRTVSLGAVAEQAVTGATPATRLERREQTELVNRFLGQLKFEHREVLVLREYQNMSYEEIAAVTKTTVSSVKSRLFKARRRLAGFLEPWLGSDDTHRSRTAIGITPSQEQ